MEKYQEFPHLKTCRINLQSETGEDWGGLEKIFNERQLCGKIYTITISLFAYEIDGHLESGMEEDDFFIGDIDSFLNLDWKFSEVCKTNNGKLDTSEDSYWFTRKADAKTVCSQLKKVLVSLGYSPYIQE